MILSFPSQIDPTLNKINSSQEHPAMPDLKRKQKNVSFLRMSIFFTFLYFLNWFLYENGSLKDRQFPRLTLTFAEELTSFKPKFSTIEDLLTWNAIISKHEQYAVSQLL